MAILFAYFLLANAKGFYLLIARTTLDDFYDPFYSEEFDVNNVGRTITIDLNHKYNIGHGIQLISSAKPTPPFHKPIDVDFFYEFKSEGKLLHSGMILKGIRNHGKSRIRIGLLNFDLPYKGISRPVSLSITLLAPIEVLQGIKEPVYLQYLPTESK